MHASPTAAPTCMHPRRCFTDSPPPPPSGRATVGGGASVPGCGIELIPGASATGCVDPARYALDGFGLGTATAAAPSVGPPPPLPPALVGSLRPCAWSAPPSSCSPGLPPRPAGQRIGVTSSRSESSGHAAPQKPQPGHAVASARRAAAHQTTASLPCPPSSVFQRAWARGANRPGSSASRTRPRSPRINSTAAPSTSTSVLALTPPSRMIQIPGTES